MADGTPDDTPGSNGPVTNPNPISAPSANPFNGRATYTPPPAGPGSRERPVPGRPAGGQGGTGGPGVGGDHIPQAPQAPQAPPAAPAGEGQQSGGRQVRGRIDIADEVIEKVAAAAAYEVDGVADLGGDVASALEWMRERIGIGRTRDDDGVGAVVGGGRAEIDVSVTVKYGHSIVEVARRVQANVAYQTRRMLGLEITAVNVTVDDIEMPEDVLTFKDEDAERAGSFSVST